MKKLAFYLLTILMFSIHVNAQWEECIGLSGKYVKCLAINGNNIFAGTIGEGIFRSTDNGITWEQKNRGLVSLRISCITVKDSVIYIGTTEKGIFTSTDIGESWVEKNNGLEEVVTTAINYNEYGVFAGFHDGGLYFTNDTGNTWTQWDKEGIDVQSIAIQNNIVVAASEEYGIFLSLDYGKTWVNKYNLQIVSMRITTISLIDSIIFLGTRAGGGIYFSMDIGDNWLQKNIGLVNLIIYSIAYYNNYFFVGTGDGIYLSSNNGDLWISKNNGLTDLSVLTILLNNNFIYIGTSKGLFKSNVLELINTGVIDDTIQCSFKLFPNPASSSIDVLYNLQSLGNAQLIITNSYGQQVYNANVNNINPSQEQKLSIDISTFPNSLYFVTLRSPAVALTKGVVVLK